MLLTLDPTMSTYASCGVDTYPHGKRKLFEEDRALFKGTAAEVHDWMTPEHILQCIGCNFRVVDEELYSKRFDRTYHDVKHWYRDDTGERLGTFGPIRKPIQPRTFIEFFRHACSAMHRGLSLDVVGSLDNGRTFYMASKISENFNHLLLDSTLGDKGAGMHLADRRSPSYVEKADRTEMWLVITDYYKETKAPKAFLLTNELVCSNGMSRVVKDNLCSLSHLRDQNFSQVASVLEQALAQATGHLKMKEIMVNTKITMETAQEALRTFFDDKEAETKKVKTLERIYEKDLIGGDYPTRQNNLWRLWNTETQYNSHVGIHKKEARFRSQLDGAASRTDNHFTNFLLKNYV